MSNIDDIQDSVDRLVLSVFDAVRSHEEVMKLSGQNTHITSDSWEKIQEIHQKQVQRIVDEYKSAENHIDNLKGIHRNSLEQRDEMMLLSKEYQDTKTRILKYEERLREVSRSIDSILLQKLESKTKEFRNQEDTKHGMT